MESGNGLASGQQMHNGMHGWIGGSSGQMSQPLYSPHDPFFYLHHCNIDRLWAMWQADGHANEYPSNSGLVGVRTGVCPGALLPAVNHDGWSVERADQGKGSL